tara:strand:+ start:141 stop:467 length:327 start_codon:yes stop_codon:yes gene_type:complete
MKNIKKSKQLTFIEDPNMEPYFITKDDHCWTVQERVMPNANHFRTKGKGKEYHKPQTYHPTLGSALESISKLLLHTKKNYTTVDQIIQEYKKIETKIKNYTYELRSAI